MKYEISVSEDYIESLCERLEEWSNEKDSFAIPQFLKLNGIGWSFFQSIMESHPKLRNQFEVTIAGLYSKWFDYAMRSKSLPNHIDKILTKYLRVYDSHAFQVETELKKEVSEITKIITKNYAVEDYSKERLEGLYKSLYESESNKRRS